MTDRHITETDATDAEIDLRTPPAATEGDMEFEERVQGLGTGDHILLPSDLTDDYRARWESIQATFVDDPRQAVSRADGLVGEVMDTLRSTFENQRQRLDAGWDDDEASTEDLRLALTRYRSFFERLLRT